MAGVLVLSGPNQRTLGYQFVLQWMLNLSQRTLRDYPIGIAP